MILADHSPLTSEDKTWLVEKCQEWARKIDACLVEIEAGSDVVRVRREVDDVVRKLISSLRERAERRV